MTSQALTDADIEIGGTYRVWHARGYGGGKMIRVQVVGIASEKTDVCERAYRVINLESGRTLTYTYGAGSMYPDAG